MKCPSCTNMLLESKMGIYRIFSCENCHGIWVAGTQIKQMLRDNGIPPSMNALPVVGEGGLVHQSNRQCSSCANVELGVYSVKGVEVDICKQCNGVFFDRNELQLLFPKDGRVSGKDIAEYTALEIVFQGIVALFKGVC